MGVFVIAEAATTWRYGDELATAKRSIEAAKACGADAWKTQWTSYGNEMARRRGMSRFGQYDRLMWSKEWHPRLKAMCEEVGIEYMCTVFLEEDIPSIEPYVSRFKISAFEKAERFFTAHYGYDKGIIKSINPSDSIEGYPVHAYDWPPGTLGTFLLHCVSEYPTPIENVNLACIRNKQMHGLSDHTTSTLTGAVAVGCGARLIEKHVKSRGVLPADPDYHHSLWLDSDSSNIQCNVGESEFAKYVSNIRLAERML